jgi:hypothetical protein
VTPQPTDADHLARITKQAAEIAALVPEHLQEAAFNRAFDQLSGGHSEMSGTQPSRRGRQTRSKPNSSTVPPQPSTGGSDDPAVVLTSSLNRTDHPEVGKASRALDRALYILRIAEANYGIDGMTAPQIAKVLTDKFRQRVTRQAINQALDAAGDYVDRTPTKRGVVYRLMQPAEDYLDAGGADTRGQTTSPKSSRRAVAKPRAQTKAKNETGSTSTGAATRKRSGRGPKAMIEELISEGFFNEPQAIAGIQDRLRHKKGVQFKPTDLSPALVRLLRQNKLDRERNESNQYEYSVPS